MILRVSKGPTVTMPNLVNLSEAEAMSRLEKADLVYAGSEYVASSQPAGTVIGQSVEADTEVNAYTAVTLRVSSGPESP